MDAALMGDYEVVLDTRTAETSLRLLRVRPRKGVLPHFHRNTTQIYIVVMGAVQIQTGKRRLRARPFRTVEVPPRTIHALSASKPSLVLSVSIPPLSMDDQYPVGKATDIDVTAGELAYGK